MIRLVLFIFLIIIGPLAAEVEPPNYDFSLKRFEDFSPGIDYDQLKKKYGAGKLMAKMGKAALFRFEIKHNRYVFPVFVQIYQNKIVDHYAKLPSYFLHDIFHQSLINRYGKQKHYQRVEEQAIYIWEQADKKIIYSGGCTITCFPIYYAMTPATPPADLKSYQSLIDLMQTKPSLLLK